MINLLQDIWSILTSFTLVDYILYFSVVTLIVLIVSLIYVIKNEKKEISREQLEIEVENMRVNNIENDELDLQSIINVIDEKPKVPVDMTSYESEQEQKAIISYEELIKTDVQERINYSDEELIDNIIPVKKISINPIEQIELTEGFKLMQKEPIFEIQMEETVKEEKEVRLFSYEKEEAFLFALKQLNELLN